MARRWLGSAAALGAAALACGAIAGLRPSRPTGDAAAALALEGRLRERAAALAARVTTLSDLPRLAAAVATDAATVRDLTTEELAFRPRPGEVITIAQAFTDGKLVTLLTLPEGAAGARTRAAGGAAAVVARRLVLSMTAKIVPLARADELSGLVTVAWPIDGHDLGAGIIDPAMAARLEIGADSVPLAGAVDEHATFALSRPIHFPEGFSTAANLAIVVGGPLLGSAPILWVCAGLLAVLAALAWLVPRSRARLAHDDAVLDQPVDEPPKNTTAPLGTGGAVVGGSGRVSAAPVVAVAVAVDVDPFAAARAGDGPSRIGRYTIMRPLGGGGMAEVFLARAEGEAGFGKLVAFKILQPTFAALPQAVELFLDEARLVAGLSHPNIVQTHDLGRAGDRYFIAMEYVDGADLERLVARVTAGGGRVPIPIALSILSRICDGLNAAHTAVGPDGQPLWLVHRDVKSANVFVSRAGAVKVGDFGIAKATHAVRVSRTEIGEVKGTPGYMPPEQRLGTDVDRRADVYGVGAIAYEMLSGAPVNLDLAVLAARGTVGWPHLAPLASLRDDVPPGLDALVVKALAYDRSDRFADCAEMERALGAITAAGADRADDKAIGAWVRSTLGTDDVPARYIASR